MSRSLDIKLDQILFWQPGWELIHSYYDGIPGDYETGFVQRYLGGDQERLPYYSSNWDDLNLVLKEMTRRSKPIIISTQSTPNELAKIIFEKLGGEKRVMFEDYYRLWQTKAMIHSFYHTIMKCPGFSEIVAMGKDVLPFIFEKLKIASEGIDFIFLAAQEITGEDPAKDYYENIKGTGFFKFKPKVICDAWLRWAKEKEYIE